MKHGTLLAALVAAAFLFAWAPRAGAQYRGAAAYRNPYTGGAYAGRTAYNPYTGGAYHASAARNPYTGTASATRSYTNPYTGRTTTAGAAYNPYTNRYAVGAKTTYP
jgi:hypothetical protein